jgi:hypothetical protein
MLPTSSAPSIECYPYKTLPTRMTIPFLTPILREKGLRPNAEHVIIAKTTDCWSGHF